MGYMTETIVVGIYLASISVRMVFRVSEIDALAIAATGHSLNFLILSEILLVVPFAGDSLSPFPTLRESLLLIFLS